MEYYIAIISVFIISFLCTELYRRLRGNRKVNVIIKGSDGSRRIFTIVTGRDREFDRLIKEAKLKKRKAVHG